MDCTTTDDSLLDKPEKIIFAHPWIQHILGRSSAITCGDDSESDAGSYPDLGCDTASREIVTLHVVPTPPVDYYTRALQLLARLSMRCFSYGSRMEDTRGLLYSTNLSSQDLELLSPPRPFG